MAESSLTWQPQDDPSREKKAFYRSASVATVAGMPSHSLAVGKPKPRESDPLRRFGEAKKRASDLFNRLDSVLSRTLAIFRKSERSDEIAEVETFANQVKGIRDVIGRDSMKVVFFGRTSNGKSSCINAMLHQSILPSGIGHTTSCFCSVQGTDSPEAPFLLTSGSNERQNVETVQQLASSLQETSLQHESMVQVFWPRERCRLLKEDVELVDSPGIDISPDSDTWIDKICLDADVFVLVSNAESTLMTTEKQFFHKVSNRLSKPNVFILNNRWDASAGEDQETMRKVREQHLRKDKDFLVNELRVVEKTMAEDRVFFVSAKEVLQSRTEGFDSLTAEGSHDRLREFETFEKKFEACLSQSAISTKFKQHVTNGRHISEKTEKMLINMKSTAEARKSQCKDALKDRHEEIAKIDRTKKNSQKEWEQKIKETTSGVHDQVKEALKTEIQRLRELVNGYSANPFSVNNVDTYKEGLCGHLESQFDQKMMASCNSSVSQLMRQAQQEMLCTVQSAIPQHLQMDTSNVVSSQDVVLCYELDFGEICANFQPDLKFKFSWGMTTLRHWVGSQVVAGNAVSVETDAPSFALWMSQKITAQSVWPAITVGAAIWQTIGWKVAATLGLGLLCLYGYERLCWTTRVQENAFKDQFVGYTADKLGTVVAMKSKDCKQQVDRELIKSVSHLKGILGDAMKQLDDDVSKLERDIDVSTELEKKANGHIFDMETFRSEFEKFSRNYLEEEE